MKNSISATLRRILRDTELETQISERRYSKKRLKQLIKDAPPVLSLRDALSSGSAVIAEIKECSPSQGRMRKENVCDAPFAYKSSRIVKAVSVLTNISHFGRGMTMERLKAIKEQTGKPVLRKDFIITEYQVLQARAFGADAILLMANILDAEELKRLAEIANGLKMDVLFEVHTPEEVEDLPRGLTSIVGINCRNFDSRGGFRIARFFREWFSAKHDKSVNLSRFEFIDKLPAKCVKVAESGVHAGNCVSVFEKGFDAALIGTSLLTDSRGISAALKDFENVLVPHLAPSRATRKAVEPALA